VAIGTAFAAIGLRHACTRGTHVALVHLLVGVVALGCIGFSTNAWCYGVGIRARADAPSRFAYLIGMTPPKACVTWRDVQLVPYELHAAKDANGLVGGQTTEPASARSWRASKAFLLLGQAGDRNVIYDFDNQRVYQVPLADAQVDARPHGLADNGKCRP
jgi:hypothetical protein